MSEQNRQCSDTGCDKTSCESCDHANTAINFSAPLHEMSTVTVSYTHLTLPTIYSV